MAQTFYTAENLGFPFRYLRELAMVISPDGNIVHNNGLKLVVVLGGKCLHHFDNGKPSLLETGDVLVAASQAKQFYELPPQENSARLHALVVIFDARYFSGKIEESLQKEQREMIQFTSSHFYENVHLKNVLDASLFEIIAQIRHEAELTLPGFRWRITSLCASGIVQLARKMSENSAPERQHFPPNLRGTFLVNRAKEYLLRHLTNDVSLSDVAAYLQVSNGHLAHTFKRVVGQSLFTYFRQLRLEQAKLQLLNSEKNVTEIAAASGFSSSTLFCRNFKEYTGHTPLSYRDELGAGIEK
jgi:AraC-like DNA-binding protein